MKILRLSTHSGTCVLFVISLTVTTICSVEEFVLAHSQTSGPDFHVDGSDLDANGEPGPSLFLNVVPISAKENQAVRLATDLMRLLS
ncbi:MAG: hypothetical protein IIB75_08255 [Proteobacteria bacterium]|nr:hypothetical protein [Pseudomonadota bacterium]